MRRQAGFTLIEIAIVLVILGLLLGVILKSQELITGARVRKLISQQDVIKVAFLGFEDRFRAPPGDYAQATMNISGIATSAACGNGNGNRNRQIETTNNEMVLAWEHLSKSGFLTGTYTCAATESNTTTPVNLYGVNVRLIYDGTYGIASGGAPRHNIKTGAQIPVDILAEVDRKIDDGAPYAGGFQFSSYQGNAVAAPTESAPTAPACTNTNTTAAVWSAANNSANCGGASLL